jgi:DNA-binding beta-propeller fold protein YncE
MDVNTIRTLLVNLLIIFLLIPHPAEAFRVGGLKTPASFIVDPALGNYFISNINGKPMRRDNNGFIVKLDGSGKSLLVIRGGDPQITLNAPEALALKGNSLYVTDIDSVRWFDKNTGKPLGHIDMTGIGAKQLKGLAFDGEGNLYVSDVLANTIYKVDTTRKVSIFSRDNRLVNPSAMVYDLARQRLIVVTRATGKIYGIGLDRKIAPVINTKTTFKSLNGVDWDREGNLLVSDKTDGKIYRIRKFSRTEIVRENILTPAGISFDYARNLILVPSSKGNLAFTIP